MGDLRSTQPLQLAPASLSALWFGGAHASLLAALAIVCAWPSLLADTFWHPRLLAAVHLLTLGWISGSILGALYLVSPFALRVRLGRHAGDPLVWGLFTSATAAMAAGFWRLDHRLVAVAGVAALLAAAWVAWRVLPPLARAPVPGFVRRNFFLAFGGLLLAGGLGVAVALDRRHPFLPGGFFAKTFAHAELAWLGWASMMVIAAGYRLLPMLLPAAMPAGLAASSSGPLLFFGAVAVAAGVLTAIPACLLAGGVAALAAALLFLITLVRMLRQPRPRPRARPRPDLPLVHVAAAVAALLAAIACGVALWLVGPVPAPGLRAAHGVLALVGFLAQLVVGVEQRLIAWQAWLLAYSGSGFRAVPPSPYAISIRPLQWAIVLTWLPGVLALAAGAGWGSADLVRLGACLLLAGTAASALVLAHALRIATAAPVAGELDATGGQH